VVHGPTEVVPVVLVEVDVAAPVEDEDELLVEVEVEVEVEVVVRLNRVQIGRSPWFGPAPLGLKQI